MCYETKGIHQYVRQGVKAVITKNTDIWSRVLSGHNERREQIACSGNGDDTIDKALGVIPERTMPETR